MTGPSNAGGCRAQAMVFVVVGLLTSAACGEEAVGPTADPTPDSIEIELVSGPSYRIPSFGDEVRLRALVFYGSRWVTDQEVTWSSSDPAAASVTPDGVVTAHAEGMVEIHATTGSVSDTWRLSVLQVVDSSFLSPRAVVLAPGDTARFFLELYDANGFEIVRDAEWIVDSLVASVSDSVLTATGAQLDSVTLEVRVDDVVVEVQSRFREVAVGDGLSCALTLDGVAYCWGYGGRLGGAWQDQYASDAPRRIPDQPVFASLAVTGDEACGLTQLGEVRCWPEPPRTTGMPPLATFDLGDATMCGLDASGKAFCGGRNSTGELGVGDNVDRPVADTVVGELRFAELSAGREYSCGVSLVDEAFCWGTAAALGSGDGIHRSVPTMVAGGHAFASISAGRFVTCALDTSGAAWCWGTPILGDGQLRSYSQWAMEPVPVSGGRSFKSIVAPSTYYFGSINRSFTGGHVCALDLDDRGWCWGSNNHGQVGDGETMDALDPVAVEGDHRFESIALGPRHSCAVDLEGRVWCWGRNQRRELTRGGTETVEQEAVPTLIVGSARE